MATQSFQLTTARLPDFRPGQITPVTDGFVRFINASNEERLAFLRQINGDRSATIVYGYNDANGSLLVQTNVPHASAAGGPPYWCELN